MINPVKKIDNLEELSLYLHVDVQLLSFKKINNIFGFDNFILGEIRYVDGSSLRIWNDLDDKSGIYGAKISSKKRFMNTLITIYDMEDIIYARWTKDNYSYSYIKSKNEDIFPVVKEIIKRMAVV